MSSTPDGGSIDLAYYLDVPRRRWRVVAASMLLALLAGLLATQLIPTAQTATATVTVAPLSTALFLDGSSPADITDITAEADLFESDVVSIAAAEELGVPRLADDLNESVEATGLVGETSLTVTYEDGNVRDAVDRLNALAAAFLETREQNAEVRRDEQLELIDERVDTLRDELTAAQRVIASGRLNGNPNSPQVLAALDTRKVLVQQLGEAEAQRSAVGNIVLQGGSIASAASPATTIASPSPALVVASCLALGLLIGLILAFIRERTDRTVGREAVVRHITGAPVLANVGLAAHHRWLSPQEEQQMQLLRARLLAGLGSDRRVLFVVGSSPKQSSAGMARHLAESLARGGQQVSLLLIGGTGAGPESGALSDTIEVDRVGMGVNGVELADLVQTPLVMDRIDTLRVSSRFARGHAGSDLAIVAADAPLDRASVIALARVADGVLLIVDTRLTRTVQLNDVSRDIEQAGTPLVGTVLSRSKRRAESTSTSQRAHAS
jgi:capsular polysaccharide biosynthesis protein